MTERHPPIGLLAELTHRCPLKCGYCSNPTELLRRERELSTAQWLGVLEQAEALGLLQVHLSGGEPAARADPEAIIGCCARLGLYSNLITSGVQIDARRLSQLCDAGPTMCNSACSMWTPARPTRLPASGERTPANWLSPGKPCGWGCR